MLKTYREADLTPKHQGFVYQVEAFEAVKDLPYSAVFHEQGLGKTKIGVDWFFTGCVRTSSIQSSSSQRKVCSRTGSDELAVHTHLKRGFSAKTSGANSTRSIAPRAFTSLTTRS